MSLKIDDFLRTTVLPKQYFSENFYITEKFKEEADKFLKSLKQCNGAEFNVDQQKKIEKEFIDVIDIAEKNIKSIVTIFTKYEASDLKAAQEEFDDLMTRIKDDIFISSIARDMVKLTNGEETKYTSFRMYPKDNYFRIRKTEYEDANIAQNPDELFHIPLNKRAYSNNQRFSLAGFPSLYLSTMLPLAWQECGYPQKYYYSEYQYEYKSKADMSVLYDDNIKFVGLYSPYEIYRWGTSQKHNDFDFWLGVIVRYLKTYPLTLACSFVNHSGEVPYKQEYIIPQMLLQWVKRNSNFVQGISYFSCVDRTKFQSEWCAYNIVVLVLPELDDKGYSNTLREKFNWSKPNFYTPPLIDKNKNYKDRETVHELIENITYIIKMNNLPNPMEEHLRSIEQVACCFMSLLENATTMNMELAIHILDLLEEKSRTLEEVKIDDIINKSYDTNTASQMGTRLEKENICDKFKKFYEYFLEESHNKKRLSNIIHKYETTLWNDTYDSSSVIIICKNSAEAVEPLEWLKENHILRSEVVLSNNNEDIQYLRKIAKDCSISIDDFWGSHVESDEWIKNNLHNMKTPIFIKVNNFSIASPPDRKMFELLQVGFDKKALADKLNL